MFTTSRFISNITQLLDNTYVDTNKLFKLLKFRLNNYNTERATINGTHLNLWTEHRLINTVMHEKMYAKENIKEGDTIPLSKMPYNFIAKPLTDSEIDELVAIVTDLNSILKTLELPKQLQLYGKGTLLRSIETMQNNLRSAFEVISSQHILLDINYKQLTQNYLECGELSPITDDSLYRKINYNNNIHSNISSLEKYTSNISNYSIVHQHNDVLPNNLVNLINIPISDSYIDKYDSLHNKQYKIPSYYIPPLISLGGRKLTTYEFIQEFDIQSLLIDTIKERYLGLTNGDIYYNKFLDMLPYLNMSKLPTPLLHVLSEIYVSKNMYQLQKDGTLPHIYTLDADSIIKNPYSITDYAMSDIINYIDNKGTKYTTLYDLYSSKDYLVQQIINLFEKELLIIRTNNDINSYKIINKIRHQPNMFGGNINNNTNEDTYLLPRDNVTYTGTPLNDTYIGISNPQLIKEILSYRVKNKPIVPFNNPNTNYIELITRLEEINTLQHNTNNAVGINLMINSNIEGKTKEGLNEIQKLIKTKYSTLEQPIKEVENFIEDKIYKEWFNITPASKLMLSHIHQLLTKANVALPLYTLHSSFNLEFYKIFKDFTNSVIDDALLSCNIATSSIDTQPSIQIATSSDNSSNNTINTAITKEKEPTIDTKLYPTAQFLYNVLSSNEEDLAGLSTYQEILSKSDGMYTKYLTTIEKGMDKIYTYLHNKDKIAYYFQGIDLAIQNKDNDYIKRYTNIYKYIHNIAISSCININRPHVLEYFVSGASDRKTLAQLGIYAPSIYAQYMHQDIIKPKLYDDLLYVNNKDYYNETYVDSITNTSYRKFKEYNTEFLKLNNTKVILDNNVHQLCNIILTLLHRLGDTAISYIKNNYKGGINEEDIAYSCVDNGLINIYKVIELMEAAAIEDDDEGLSKITSNKLYSKDEQLLTNIQIIMDIVNYITCTFMAIEDMLNEQDVLDMVDTVRDKVAPKVMLDSTNDAIVLGSSISPAEILTLQSNYITAPIGYLLDADLEIYDKVHNLKTPKNIFRLPGMLTTNTSHDITKLTDKNRAKIHADLIKLEDLVIKNIDALFVTTRDFIDRFIDVILSVTLMEEINFTLSYPSLKNKSNSYIKKELINPYQLYNVLLEYDENPMYTHAINLPFIVAYLYVAGTSNSKYSYLDDNYQEKDNYINAFNKEDIYVKIQDFLKSKSNVMDESISKALRIRNNLNVKCPTTIPFTRKTATEVLNFIYSISKEIIYRVQPNPNDTPDMCNVDKTYENKYPHLGNIDSVGVLDVSYNSFTKVVGLLSSTPSRHNRLLAKLFTKSLLKSNYIIGEQYYKNIEEHTKIKRVINKVKSLMNKPMNNWYHLNNRSLKTFIDKIKDTEYFKNDVKNIIGKCNMTNYMHIISSINKSQSEQLKEYLQFIKILRHDYITYKDDIMYLLSPGVYNSNKIPLPNKLHFSYNDPLQINSLMDNEYLTNYVDSLYKLDIFTKDQKSKYIKTVSDVIYKNISMSDNANTDLSMLMHLFVATPTYTPDNRIITTYNIMNNIKVVPLFTGIHSAVLFRNLLVDIPTTALASVKLYNPTSNLKYPLFSWHPYTLKAGSTTYPSMDTVYNFIYSPNNNPMLSQVRMLNSMNTHINTSYLGTYKNIESPTITIHNIIPAVYKLNKNRSIQVDGSLAYYEKSNQSRYRLGNPKIYEDMYINTDSEHTTLKYQKGTYESNPKDNIDERLIASSIVAEHVNLVDELYHSIPTEEKIRGKRLINYYTKDYINSNWDNQKDIILGSYINVESTLHKGELLSYLVHPQLLNEAMQESIKNTYLNLHIDYKNRVSAEINNPDVLQLINNPFISIPMHYMDKDKDNINYSSLNADTGVISPHILSSTQYDSIYSIADIDRELPTYINKYNINTLISEVKGLITEDNIHTLYGPIFINQCILSKLLKLEVEPNDIADSIHHMALIYHNAEKLLNMYRNSNVSIRELIPEPKNALELFIRDYISNVENIYKETNNKQLYNFLGLKYYTIPLGAKVHYPFTDIFNYLVPTLNYTNDAITTIANPYIYPKLVYHTNVIFSLNDFYKKYTPYGNEEKQLFSNTVSRYTNLELPSIEREYSLLNLLLYRLQGLYVPKDLINDYNNTQAYILNGTDVQKNMIYFINDVLYNRHIPQDTSHSIIFPSYYLTTLIANGLQPSYSLVDNRTLQEDALVKYTLKDNNGKDALGERTIELYNEKCNNVDIHYTIPQDIIVYNPYYNFFNTAGFFNKFLFNSIIEHKLNRHITPVLESLVDIYRDIDKLYMHNIVKQYSNNSRNVHLNKNQLENKLKNLDNVQLYAGKEVYIKNARYKSIYNSIMLATLRLVAGGDIKYNLMDKNALSDLTELKLIQLKSDSLLTRDKKDRIKRDLSIMSSICSSLYKQHSTVYNKSNNINKNVAIDSIRNNNEHYINFAYNVPTRYMSKDYSIYTLMFKYNPKIENIHNNNSKLTYEGYIIEHQPHTSIFDNIDAQVTIKDKRASHNESDDISTNKFSNYNNILEQVYSLSIPDVVHDLCNDKLPNNKTMLLHTKEGYLVITPSNIVHRFHNMRLNTTDLYNNPRQFLNNGDNTEVACSRYTKQNNQILNRVDTETNCLITKDRIDLLISNYVDKAYSIDKSINEFIINPADNNVVIAPYYTNNYIPDYFKTPNSYINVGTDHYHTYSEVNYNKDTMSIYRYNPMVDLIGIYNHRRDIIYDVVGNILPQQYGACNTVTTLIHTLCKEINTHQLSNYYGIHKKPYQNSLQDNNVGVTLEDIPANVYKPAASAYLNSSSFQLTESFGINRKSKFHKMFSLYKQVDFLNDWNNCTVVNKHQVNMFSNNTYNRVNIPISKNIISLLKEKGIKSFSNIIERKRQLIFQYKDSIPLDELNEFVDSILVKELNI